MRSTQRLTREGTLLFFFMGAPKESIEKSSGIQVEYPMDDRHDEAEGDYSGATKKTDPAEIALVKKLDIRIMTILWAMYFLVGNPIRHRARSWFKD